MDMPARPVGTHRHEAQRCGPGADRYHGDNAAFQRLQKRIAAATILVPFAFTLLAVALLFYRPLTWVDVTLMLVMYVITTLGVTAGFHRQFAHRSFKAKPALRVALGIMGSMAGQGNLIYWVATHRRHHQFSEGEGDPHSPYVMDGKPWAVRGVWHSHLGWMLDSQMTNTVKFTKACCATSRSNGERAYSTGWRAASSSPPLGRAVVVVMVWRAVGLSLGRHGAAVSGADRHVDLGLNPIALARPFKTREHEHQQRPSGTAQLGEPWHKQPPAFPSRPCSGCIGGRWTSGAIYPRLCCTWLGVGCADADQGNDRAEKGGQPARWPVEAPNLVGRTATKKGTRNDTCSRDGSLPRGRGLDGGLYGDLLTFRPLRWRDRRFEAFGRTALPRFPSPRTLAAGWGSSWTRGSCWNMTRSRRWWPMCCTTTARPPDT